jgi:hypothetical protein
MGTVRALFPFPSLKSYSAVCGFWGAGQKCAMSGAPGAYALGEAGPVRVNEWEVLKMKIRPPAA